MLSDGQEKVLAIFLFSSLLLMLVDDKSFLFLHLFSGMILPVIFYMFFSVA